MNIKVLKEIIHTHWLSIFLLNVAVAIVVRPLLHDGFFPTFDDVQVVRVSEMSKELHAGQFPVRFLNDLGNGGGYNLFTFYPPFAYYIGSLIHLVGIPLVKSVKLTFIFGYVIAGGGMYLLVKHFLSQKLAVIGAILFLISPFLNYEVFIRGALAEFYGMALFPVTLYLLLKLHEKRNLAYFCLFGISLASMILSHTFVGIFGSLFCVLLAVFVAKNKKDLLIPLLGMFLGIILASWFWLPVVIQQGQTKYSESFFAMESYKTNFLSLFELSGVNPPNWDFLPPTLGILLSVFTLAAIFQILIDKRRRSSSILLFLMLGFIGSLFFILPQSSVIWQSFPQLQFMQFPWRFLVFSTVFAVILTVVFISTIKSHLFQIVFGFVIILACFILNKSYLSPVRFNYIDEYFAEDACGTTTWAQEYLPKEVQKCLPRSKQHLFTYPKVIASKPGVSLEEVGHGREVVVTSSGSAKTVSVRKYFSPGWRVVLDGKIVLPVFASKPYGLVSFNLPAGDHKARVSLLATKSENTGVLISIIGVIISIASFFALKTHIINKKS